jgi:anti-sigma regulatory factor (Ser/Thr protein kinase)
MSVGERTGSRRRDGAVTLRRPVASPSLFRTLRVAGGPAAPRAARAALASVLDGCVAADVVAEAGLVASELVSNSVLYARSSPDGSIGVDVGLFADRLRIAVVDGGSHRVPHIVPEDPARPGGKGLLLVVRLSAAWGIVREQSGRTRVWCDLPVNPPTGVGDAG